MPLSKRVFGIVLTIVIMATALIIFGYVVLQRTIPDTAGIMDSDKFSSETKIYTDSAGIVYIEALNEDDAVRATGFVHARDRLFQMEIMRRAAAGRISELTGSDALPIDIMFRKIGLARIAERDYEKLDDKTKHLLTMYAEGVNEFLEKYGERFTPELNLISSDIEKWRAEDSYLVSKLMGWVLNLSWWTDAAYIDLAKKFGAEKVEDIIPKFDENYPTIISMEGAGKTSLTEGFVAIDKIFRKLAGLDGTQVGSNNWVIGEGLSKNGKPIVANDPHLSVTNPNVWYAAVISYPGKIYGGFTIPGSPGVVIGSNRFISWGYTNVMADDCDFYKETIDSSGINYLLGDEWKKFEVIEDTIHVKDSADVVISTRINHRGPVINDIRPEVLLHGGSPGEDVITMRWTGYEFSDEIGAIHRMNRASTLDEFTEGVKGFKIPGQNFLYADSTGNIGYICAARLPIRKNDNPTYIFDGSDPANDWTGFVPFNEMPRVLNPGEGFVASANNKVVKNFRHHISNIWEPTSRIERIRELLATSGKKDIDYVKHMQMDVKSVYASKMIPKIIAAFNETDISDDNLKTALELFRQWDYRMDKSSQAPAIFSVFKIKLLKNLFIDEMGRETFEEYAFLTNIPHRILEEYFDGRVSSWADNVKTEKKETFEDIVRASLADALTYLEKNYGKDISGWQWGELHKLKFTHPFSMAAPVTGNLFDIGPFEISGDGTTLFNTEFSFVEPYDVKVIASMRMIYDFSDPDYLHISLPTGQSGNFMSDHYDDLTDKWLNGGYYKVSMTTGLFENEKNDLFVINKSN